MKRTYYTIILAVSLCINSCYYNDFSPTDWAIEPVLELSNYNLIFNSSEGVDTIRMKTNYKMLSVHCDSLWCSYEISPNNENLILHVKPNLEKTQRSCIVYINIARGNKELTKSITIVQRGGYWEIVNNFSVYWSSDATDIQRKIITEMLDSMVWVEGGTFIMGSEKDYCQDNEDSRHNVTLSSYYISKIELPQRQWSAIMGSVNPHFTGDNLPVENISWEEAMNFMIRLTELAQIKDWTYSLPTEAQWEYAARGGEYSLGYTYPGSNTFGDVLIYKGDKSKIDPAFTTYEVGSLKPNELGLYNMAGNVSEMCLDWFAKYELCDQVDPVGPAMGERHVIRGGDITDVPIVDCKVSSRWQFYTKTSQYIGVRLCIRK